MKTTEWYEAELAKKDDEIRRLTVQTTKLSYRVENALAENERLREALKSLREFANTPHYASETMSQDYQAGYEAGGIWYRAAMIAVAKTVLKRE